MMIKDTESRILFFLKKLLFLSEDKDCGDHLFRRENFLDFLIFVRELQTYLLLFFVCKYIGLLLIKNTEHMNLGSLPENEASNWLLFNFYQKSTCKKTALLKGHTIHSFHEKF